jgi:PKD repeat protein
VTGPGGSDFELKTNYITVSVSHLITATAGAGGTISPGSVSVANGTSQTFTISRNPGYYIVDVLVNGDSIGAVSTYTFTNVVTDGQTIHATFAQNPRGQIYYEGFESGSTGWVLNGASRENGAVPKNQTWSMRLQNKDSMYLTIPTTGFSSIEVQFAWALTSNAGGENAYAEYSTNGGSTWTILSQINGPVTQNTLSVAPISSLPTSARLQFRIAGSNTQDQLYVDDVILTGIPD